MPKNHASPIKNGCLWNTSRNNAYWVSQGIGQTISYCISELVMVVLCTTNCDISELVMVVLCTTNCDISALVMVVLCTTNSDISELVVVILCTTNCDIYRNLAFYRNTLRRANDAFRVVTICIKVILCASEHICSIVRYCFRSFKQL